MYLRLKLRKNNHCDHCNAPLGDARVIAAGAATPMLCTVPLSETCLDGHAHWGWRRTVSYRNLLRVTETTLGGRRLNNNRGLAGRLLTMGDARGLHTATFPGIGTWRRSTLSISPQVYSVVLALVMSGCGSQLPTSDWAAPSIVVDRDLGSLTACSYTKLEASQGSGIKKVDAQNALVLALESGPVRIWELTFTPETNDRTQVHYSAVQRPWGPHPSTVEIMNEVRSCSGHPDEVVGVGTRGETE